MLRGLHQGPHICSGGRTRGRISAQGAASGGPHFRPGGRTKGCIFTQGAASRGRIFAQGTTQGAAFSSRGLQGAAFSSRGPHQRAAFSHRGAAQGGQHSLSSTTVDHHYKDYQSISSQMPGGTAIGNMSTGVACLWEHVNGKWPLVETCPLGFSVCGNMSIGFARLWKHVDNNIAHLGRNRYTIRYSDTPTERFNHL